MEEIYLSPNTLNLYTQCKRCFYLTVKYKIKRPRGPVSTLPSSIDYLIKDYFEYYRRINKLPPFLENIISGKLITHLDKTLYYRFTLRDKKVVIAGKLDECIVLEDGKYVPLDHKTRGKSPTMEQVHPSYQLQMEIYSLLLKENNYPTKDIAYLIYYFPELVSDYTAKEMSGIINFGFKVIELKLDILRAKRIINEAVECLEKDEIPESSPDCEYCRWHNAVNAQIENIRNKERFEKREVPAFKDGKLFE